MAPVGGAGTAGTPVVMGCPRSTWVSACANSGLGTAETAGTPGGRVCPPEGHGGEVAAGAVDGGSSLGAGPSAYGPAPCRCA